MNKSTSTWRARSVQLLPYIACAVPLVLYQLLYVNGYYPITEGWFSEYAHLIRGGELPYRDFSLLLPPLYPLQLAAFQAVFGEGFFALRILGVFITCAIAMALLDILKNFFNPWICGFAAAVCTVYYQSGVAYLGYDFTQFVTLYLLVAMALLLRSINAPPATGLEQRSLWLCAYAGFFSALALLIKQSNGGITALVLGLGGAIAAIVLYRPSAAFLRIAAFAGGFALPILALLLWLVGAGTLRPFIADVFVGAYTAKGGAGVFDWIGHYFTDPPGFEYSIHRDYANLLRLVVAMILVAAVTQALLALQRRRRIDRQQLLASLRQIVGMGRGAAPVQALFVSLIALTGLCVLILSLSRGKCAACEALRPLGVPVQDSVFIWSLNFYVVGSVIGLVVLLWSRRSSAARFFVLAISGVGLAFGNGASSGLSEISAFVGVAVLFAFLMNAWIGSALPTLLPVVVALGFCVPFVEAKFQAPYAWWQVVTPPVRTSACADATGILSHLCMAPDEFAKIMRIDNAILANSAPEDTIYVYPHLPVFYLLSNRTPFDGAVVSWFDFTSDALAYDLSQRLKTSTPPVIVMAEIPEIVLAAHENLFRHNRPLGQRKILASVATLLATGRIERIEHITDLTGLTVDVYKRVDR